MNKSDRALLIGGATGVATWLLGQAAAWLRLARVDRVLDYAEPEQEDAIAFLESVGFRELTRTARGWERDARSGRSAISRNISRTRWPVS